VEQNILKIQNREQTGKGVARKLRSKGILPGVVYGEGEKPVAVTVSDYEFQKMFTKTSGKNVLVDLEFENSTDLKKALVKDVQTDPVSAKILNVDFMLISMDKEITMSAPLRLTGTPEGVKNMGGILQFINREIEIACLPGEIPDSIEIDVSEMKIGDTIHFGDIEGIKYKVLSNLKVSVCTVVAPTVIRERAEVAEGEGEEGAEGEAPTEEAAAEDASQEPEVITEKKEDKK